ncbi:hypothetical protein [Acidisoma sp. 7E03]
MTFLRRFLPQPQTISLAEGLRLSLGACLGIAVTGLVSTAWFGTVRDLPLLMAPIGASAVRRGAVPPMHDRNVADFPDALPPPLDGRHLARDEVFI